MALFDQYARDYNELHTQAVKWSGFTPAYFHEYKCREMADYLKSQGVPDDQPLDLLNYGCGTGGSERYLRQYLPAASIYSVDISEESINVAREAHRHLENVVFEPLKGTVIPYEIKFDVIFVANVFHHIRRDQHLEILKHLKSRLKDGGWLFIFELNPLNPLTMLVAIREDYRFDKDAKLLAPGYAKRVLRKAGFVIQERRYTIFFPGFLSFLIPYERRLRRLPLGAHYYYVAK
jgi:SAM-dependent methyltransferase